MNDGWFKRQQVLSELEAKRQNSYETAADCEAMAISHTRRGNVSGANFYWDSAKWHYDNAARIEADIAQINKQGVNNDTEDDGSE